MIRGVFIRRAHGKLVAVHLAQHDRARRFHARDGGAVIRRDILFQNLRSRGGAHAARAHHILDTDRHATQRRQCLTFGRHPVDPVGLFESALLRKRQECADLAVFLLDAGVMRLSQRERRRFTFLHGGAGGVDGE